MSLTNAQYDVIKREYDRRQLHSRHLLDERTAYVYEHIPGYKDLEDAISATSVAQGKKLLGGDKGAMDELKSLLSDLRLQKQKMLRTAGLPDDYLEPIYECNDCKDTGYVDGVKCHCFKQAIINLLYDQSNLRQMLTNENFDTLSYEYYAGEDLDHFSNAVETCHNFVKNFNSDYHNLFFYGTVGTGKSFLSNCVAKELIESGHSVIYFSATGLFDFLSKYSFDYKSREEQHSQYSDIFDCDLLIIDDLGTELTNQFVSSRLFALINERHLGKKATVISSNLSLEELKTRYSDRIFSRITSNYELCKLSGMDIRMYKKRQLCRK